MDEKTMVNDILEGVKSDLITYQEIIGETENMRIATSNTADKK